MLFQAAQFTSENLGPWVFNNEWTVLGTVPNWKASDWPMPPLARLTEPGHRAYLSYYDENSFRCLREVEIDPETVSKYIEDGTSGYGAVEIRLTKLLS